jgi:hypothetical protein
MQKKNVGVIGNGKWAKIMLPKLSKLANIKFIADSKSGYKKFDINNISWIFVLTNIDTHYEIVKFFLRKKKNVFCEKPLTTNFFDTIKLYNYSKRKKISLYVNDVEFFKKKEIYIKNKNLIIRKKKSEFSKDSLLSRLAYHDFYLLKKFINLDNMRISILVKKKKYLSFKILSDDKIYRFIYDVNSNFKKHFINQTNFLQFKGDPLEKMLINVFKNNKKNLDVNYSNTFFASKLISLINKN